MHWKQVHSWESPEHPMHCAVLGDKVAVLMSSGCKKEDVVHISTTNLDSWSVSPLPYSQMSLTTYQSKFVAVGGRNTSTKEFSDLLFTSETGLEWEPSLPPMPTKRSETSSVSTTSPEVLVVAGGHDLSHRVSVVEVLRDYRWHSVQRLPMARSCMHPALHSGKLYFLGGKGQKHRGYSCSCESLISWCDRQSKDPAASPKSLWKRMKLPRDWTSAVSFGSRLVSIDGNCVIWGACEFTRTWVMTTDEGEKTHIDSVYTVSAVLSSGELMYVHGPGGVFKIKLSVSPFDPDSKFIPNVFCRLESLMGIRILPMLADVYSKLSHESGVRVRPRLGKRGRYEALPDPQCDPEDYVLEMVTQWSEGRGSRPPTWRQLLEVLHNIGLVELSQRIGMFMKANEAEPEDEKVKVSPAKNPC